MSSLNSRELLELYQDGQNEAATVLFDKYAKRLLALARKRIGPRINRRIDAEDVVQSAYRSFFAHAKNEEYQLKKAGDLWRLLASITLHKLYAQIERHTAAKRSIAKEQPTDAFTDTATVPEPSPSEVVALVEELEHVIQCLSPNERLVLTAKLQGQDVTQLAAAVNKSERTIRRLLAMARHKIEQRLLANDVTDAGPATSDAEHDAPLQYSEYVLAKLLGSGGMGKVFKARNRRTGETVAIKALHKARQSDKRAVSRFAQEAQVLAKLRHPNIVGVEGLGRFPGGGYFMAMEFVDGVDLQSRLDSEVLSIREALTIINDVASAIGHAHENGIIHCDLKPANVLQRTDGTILVTDFGFAFLLPSRAASVSNSVGGTAGYIAPEVLSGSGYPTSASDIYSLGVLLSVLVTGKPPEQAKTFSSANEALEPIATVLKCCLSDDANQRIQTTTELQREIVACLKLLGVE